MNYEKITIFVLLITLFFICMLKVKPKVITKTEIKEQKIYDLTQKPEVIESYANLIGKTMKDLKEIERQKMAEWISGYKEGARDAIKKR